jgi:hypothetical protein
LKEEHINPLSSRINVKPAMSVSGDALPSSYRSIERSPIAFAEHSIERRGKENPE